MKIIAVIAGVGIAYGLHRMLFSSAPTGEMQIVDVTGAPVIPVLEDPNTPSYSIVDSISDLFGEAYTVATLPFIKALGTKYDALIISSAKQYGVDPDILYKLLYEESRFREDIITGKVKSKVGALGIAQFMPATAVEELGSVNAALDPAIAIPGAARYLAKLIKSTGSVAGGVAAYNWGVGNVKRKGLTKAPTETDNYVFNITGVKI